MLSYTINVLIVDDSEAYRSLLKQAFLGHLDSCNIVEAKDGLEAVEIASSTNFDFIFMDLKMPNLEASEAIKQIRAKDPYVLIIAVTGMGDDETMQEVLRAGVADVIRKPFDAVLLEKKVYNFLSLANYRRFISGNYVSVSLFDEPVFKRTILFHIRNEDELAEFWEFFLTHYAINSGLYFSKEFYPAIKVSYEMVEILLKQNKKTTIVYESSDTFSFITIGPTRVLNKTLLKEIFEHRKKSNESKLEAIFSESRFSFKFKKFAESAEDAFQTPIVSPIKSQEQLKKDLAVQTIIQSGSGETKDLIVVDFFDEDEYEDLNDAICDLEVKLSVLQHSSLETIDALEIADSIGKISSALYPHTVFANVAIAFRSLSMDIIEDPDGFVAGSSRLGKLLKAFVDDLKEWEDKLFKSGVERLDIMNETLIADSQQISIISPKVQSQAESSVDNIFF